MKVKSDIVKIAGGVLIAVGVICFALILASFDWEYYNKIKELTYIEDEEIEFMQGELLVVWFYALVVLIGGSAAGILLMALGEILETLKLMVNDNEEEVTEESSNE